VGRCEAPAAQAEEPVFTNNFLQTDIDRLKSMIKEWFKGEKTQAGKAISMIESEDHNY
jgi:hypothetical protein